MKCTISSVIDREICDWFKRRKDCIEVTRRHDLQEQLNLQKVSSKDRRDLSQARTTEYW
jgi:hypothetical protein